MMCTVLLRNKSETFHDSEMHINNTRHFTTNQTVSNSTVYKVSSLSTSFLLTQDLYFLFSLDFGPIKIYFPAVARNFHPLDELFISFLEI